MKPGEVVRVVKGPYEGGRAQIRGGEGFFYHVQLLTGSGRKRVNGLVTLHRASVAPLEKEDA